MNTMVVGEFNGYQVFIPGFIEVGKIVSK